MTDHGFKKGTKYTRAQIAEMIGLPMSRRSGGNWVTGYDTHGDELFVFCNVGAAGRTGHNYPNRWENGSLYWSGKTGSHKDQPLMRRIVEGEIPAHIFWRANDRDAFTYAGVGAPAEVSDTVPVRIRWTFADQPP